MKNMSPAYFYLSLSLMLFIASCKKDKKAQSPVFDQAKAHAAVRTQVGFGPRVIGSEGHQKCKEWIVSELTNHGARVIQQDFKAKTFDGKELSATNIIGSFNPDSKHRIILAAHWDTRPFSDQDADTSKYHTPILGADDGGSGVGILLELSRIFNEHKLSKLGVDLIFFDAEDYGTEGEENIETWCLGSQYWSKNPHVSGYKADYGVLLDMVGAANPQFNKEYYSTNFAPKVIEKVWTIAKDEGVQKMFLDAPGNGIVDDHIFVNRDAKIPMIDIINRPIGSKTGFVSHWHTQKDDMNAIDPNTLGAVGRVLTKLIYWEDVDKI